MGHKLAIDLGTTNSVVARWVPETDEAQIVRIPGISIPCGTDSKGLPIGLQILGKHFDESTILRVADFVESSR